MKLTVDNTIRGKHRSVRLEQVYDRANVELAVTEAMRGKRRNRAVIEFEKHHSENVDRIVDALRNRTYRHSEPVMEEKYCPCGKVRLLSKMPFYDHVIHHALMRVLMPTMERSYYHHSSASIKGRGIHYAARNVRRYIDTHSDRQLYSAKLDFTKFYASIDQQLCFDSLCRMYHDDGIRWLISEVLSVLPEGLGIGLFPIQPIANFYLAAMERSFKQAFGSSIVLFVYCDDIVLIGGDKTTLWSGVDWLRRYASDVLHQGLHTGIDVTPITDSIPLDFVGYLFYTTHTLIRKKMKERFRRKMRTVKDSGKKYQMMQSYKGWLMHCDGKHLWYKITGMKTFAELNIKNDTITKDGHRIFNVPQVGCSFLVGRKLVIKDFEPDVKTKNGEGRYVVLISESEDGPESKFITNNPQMKTVLDRCREIDAFPFEATLRSRAVGSKIDYYFE